jgi:two-component system sensor histidine kinase KdpD
MDWNSLEEMVGNALSSARELISGREISVSIPPAFPLVMCDGNLIEKVILNLLENASSHTPPGTAIEISAEEMREYLRLNISDRGPGIPKSELNRIFERFFQGGEGGGFGLGLAICRAIMKLHKGRIWAENRVGGPGAVFHVEFDKLAQPEVPNG